tara:strand:+ start:302 stop:1510 length:1209 start_codon:yes stop_codon:yes gene_type:complete
MKILVMKFGGTSVANIDRIKTIASIIKKETKNYKIVVVLSAMAGVTNKLQNFIDEIGINNSSDADLVITSGEHVSVGLLSMTLNKMKVQSIPMLGWQIPIITDCSYGKAKILNIEKKIILNHLNNVDVIVLAGFQGISVENKISSLGRGGSDTTAVAIASSLNAIRCDIYTDVEGVYSTDPNIDPSAKKIDKIAYEEMLEMASMGAKVLQTRSVELAMKNNLQLQVLSSIISSSGTMIVNEEDIIEKETVSGVSYSNNEAKITISGIPDVPGIAAKIFGILSDNNISVDMIVQNISQDGIKANLTFTVQNNDSNLAINLIKKNKTSIKYGSLITNSNVAKISVIGVGMKSQSGVAKKMFETLAENKINILAISTSEIKISVLINKKHTFDAVKSLHKTYKLG